MLTFPSWVPFQLHTLPMVAKTKVEELVQARQQDGHDRSYTGVNIHTLTCQENHNWLPMTQMQMVDMGTVGSSMSTIANCTLGYGESFSTHTFNHTCHCLMTMLTCSNALSNSAIGFNIRSTKASNLCKDFCEL